MSYPNFYPLLQKKRPIGLGFLRVAFGERDNDWAYVHCSDLAVTHTFASREFCALGGRHAIDFSLVRLSSGLFGFTKQSRPLLFNKNDAMPATVFRIFAKERHARDYFNYYVVFFAAQHENRLYQFC